MINTRDMHSQHVCVNTIFQYYILVQSNPAVSCVMQDMGSHCREINKKLMTIMTDLITKQLARVSLPPHCVLLWLPIVCVCVCSGR